jgi:hypothetical protein
MNFTCREYNLHTLSVLQNVSAYRTCHYVCFCSAHGTHTRQRQGLKQYRASRAYLWIQWEFISPPSRVFFFNKNVFARDLNTYTSVPESTKIVPVQPIYMQNTRCARGHVATSSGDGRRSSEKIVTKEKTLQQKGRRSEENVFGTFM